MINPFVKTLFFKFKLDFGRDNPILYLPRILQQNPGKKSSMLRHAFSSRRYCGFYILRVPPEAVRFPVPVAQYVQVKQENGIG